MGCDEFELSTGGESNSGLDCVREAQGKDANSFVVQIKEGTEQNKDDKLFCNQGR